MNKKQNKNDPNKNWAMYNPEKAKPVDWVGIAAKRKEQAEALAEALRGLRDGWEKNLTEPMAKAMAELAQWEAAQ